ncbi:helix-turn-helix domain-containing protein [Vibrio sp. S9_S30]|nr:helix-turn-helix domain-containing protein [Vibrio sp. S9_S30]
MIKDCLNFACARLRNSDLTLAQIAILSGFARGDNLRNVFQHQYGISPMAYRQRFKRKTNE